jgi:hypothetical protein
MFVVGEIVVEVMVMMMIWYTDIGLMDDVSSHIHTNTHTYDNKMM